MAPESGSRPLLSAKGLRYEYRAGEPVLDVVDLDLAPGLTLLVGPNGCGKSTLVRLLAGVEQPHHGVIHIGGADLWQDEVAARSLLVYVPEQPELVPYATVRETVELVASLRGADADAVDRVMDEAGIEGLSGRTARELSQGQRRRVLLAAAWLGEPRVILLDEPLEALDRGIRDYLLAWIDRRLEAGAAVLVISHRIGPFVDRAAVAASLIRGQVVTRWLPEDLERRSQIVEALARGSAPAET